jgi:hypothetical protein
MIGPMPTPTERTPAARSPRDLGRAPAALVLAALLLAALALGTEPARAADPAPCTESVGVRIWSSPRAPAADAVWRLVALDDREALDELAATDPGGRSMPLAPTAHGGPPWSLVAELVAPAPGRWRIEARRGGALVACREIEVAASSEAARASAPLEPRLAWDRDTEALYSAWIEHLFDAPPEEGLSFPSLAPVLRDPARNFLHDHLGLGEDGPRALEATPDCADLPYFLRAYFAWKLGLPVSFRACSRGSANAPPRCGGPVTWDPLAQRGDRVGAFRAFSQRLADGVQSGNARTALGDDATDFYPVPLTRDALRPGTIYADPYGHTLVVVRWVPQTPERSGLLLAVDAQPDDSVGRKRFWEGSFLFASDVASAGPGFKAFRPRGLSNAALADDPRFAPYSEEQAALAPEDFYARMAKLIDPDGLAPERAYESTLDALVEQLETRVGSVDNGERYVRAHPATIPMPGGAAIFETTGPWEDYATPSRDLRLLIAMSVLTGLPDRVARHPELYVLGTRDPEEARGDVAALHERRIAERAISYTRSDGSPWRLSVAELLARRSAFEMAYNPNDCVEARWGAAEGTPERETCVRRAPAEQRARMDAVRDWFREMRRPTR